MVNILKAAKWIGILLAACLLIIVFIGMYKLNYLASKEGYDVDGNQIENHNNGKIDEQTEQ